MHVLVQVVQVPIVLKMIPHGIIMSAAFFSMGGMGFDEVIVQGVVESRILLLDHSLKHSHFLFLPSEQLSPWMHLYPEAQLYVINELPYYLQQVGHGSSKSGNF